MSPATGTPAGKERPLLSLCMIVKDEEAMLPRALGSIVEHVDEVIVVDTGSTDRTVEIAESFGAEVHVHPWQHDFSLHRNQSIGYASGEWIIYIDADERLAEASGPRLKEVIRNARPDTDSFMVHLVNWTRDGQNMGSGNLMRIFRNCEQIRFQGIVHNNLVGYRNTEVVDLTLHHYGYDLEEDVKQAKFDRTTGLLAKMIEEDPDNPVPHHYLAASHLNMKDYEAACASAERSIELMRATGREIGAQLSYWTYYIATLCHFLGGRLERSEALCVEALERNRDHLDSHAVLCSICLLRKQWDRLLHHAAEYRRLLALFKGKPQYAGLQIVNTERQEWRVALQVGIARFEKGQEVAAAGEFEAAAALAPEPVEALRGAGEYLVETGRPDRAVGYLVRACAGQPEDSEAARHLTLAARALLDAEAGPALHTAVTALLQVPERAPEAMLISARRALRDGEVDDLLDRLAKVMQLSGAPYEPGELRTREDLAQLCLVIGRMLAAGERRPAARQAVRLGLEVCPGYAELIAMAVDLWSDAADDGGPDAAIVAATAVSDRGAVAGAQRSERGCIGDAGDAERICREGTKVFRQTAEVVPDDHGTGLRIEGSHGRGGHHTRRAPEEEHQKNTDGKDAAPPDTPGEPTRRIGKWLTGSRTTRCP